MTIKGFFKGMWEAFRYLFLTPAGGSKRRAEQQAYEERLDEAMKRVQEEKGRLFEHIPTWYVNRLVLKRTIL